MSMPKNKLSQALSADPIPAFPAVLQQASRPADQAASDDQKIFSFR
jgi:hypothetical protein